MVLAVAVGAKLPQLALPQVTDQLTTAFCGPLAIVTAIPAVLSGLWWLRVAGGVKPGVKVKVMGGAIEFCAPHAERSARAPTVISADS